MVRRKKTQKDHIENLVLHTLNNPLDIDGFNAFLYTINNKMISEDVKRSDAFSYYSEYKAEKVEIESQYFEDDFWAEFGQSGTIERNTVLGNLFEDYWDSKYEEYVRQKTIKKCTKEYLDSKYAEYIERNTQKHIKSSPSDKWKRKVIRGEYTQFWDSEDTQKSFKEKYCNTNELYAQFSVLINQFAQQLWFWDLFVQVENVGNNDDKQKTADKQKASTGGNEQKADDKQKTADKKGKNDRDSGIEHEYHYQYKKNVYCLESIIHCIISGTLDYVENYRDKGHGMWRFLRQIDYNKRVPVYLEKSTQSNEPSDFRKYICNITNMPYISIICSSILHCSTNVSHSYFSFKGRNIV